MKHETQEDFVSVSTRRPWWRLDSEEPLFGIVIRKSEIDGLNGEVRNVFDLYLTADVTTHVIGDDEEPKPLTIRAGEVARVQGVFGTEILTHYLISPEPADPAVEVRIMSRGLRTFGKGKAKKSVWDIDVAVRKARSDDVTEARRIQAALCTGNVALPF